MKTSTYPRDYSFAKDGKRCAVNYGELRKARVPEFSTPEQMIEKFVLEGELESTRETVSVWLGVDGKLVSEFQAELGKRVKTGKHDFEPGELIVITQSDKQRPSRTSGRLMWDYSVEFANAAPPPTAAELLLGPNTPDGSDGALDEAAAEPPIGSQLAPDESPPF